MPRQVRAALAAALLLSAIVGGVRGAEFPVSWPEGWKSACGQFEKFIEEQNRYLPAAGLEFFADGTILTNLPQQKRSSIVFYRGGSEILSMGVADRLFSNGRESMFSSGDYIAFLQSVAGGRYETLYPFVAFRVERSEDQNHPRIRMLNPSSPADASWPNERLQRFFDFHIFPKRHRDDIYKKNSRISPDIVLSITPSGTIIREKLEPVLEKNLIWHIYRNGHLVEFGPAGGDLRHALRKPGDYVAFVGIDGPGGFMPVSNCLRFPLFPAKSGGVEVFPSVSNPDRVPDFLLDVLPPDVLSEVLSQDWAKGEGYYNKCLVYGLNSGFTVKDLEKQALLSLWTAWSWKLWTLRQEDGGIRDSDLGSINLAPAPR
jgi:hypothetical protein